MEERNIEVTIFRDKNPDKLVVYHACSLENEIRFYLNDTQYVTAMEKGEEDIIIGLVEEVESKKVKTKLKKSDYFKLFANCFLMGIVIGTIIILAFLIGVYFKNIFMYLIALNTMMFLFDIARVLVMETKTTPPCLKSKHSAEHMMVNFIEKNKRLPKSVKEFKTASRFCNGCGSRKLIEGIAEEFISKIVATIIAAISSIMCIAFMHNEIIESIIIIAVYIGVIILLEKLLKKWKKLNFLIEPIRKGLTRFAQCANTTKKVEDDDIFLAYYAAKEWIKVVYPEYYNKEQDVFLQNS